MGSFDNGRRTVEIDLALQVRLLVPSHPTGISGIEIEDK